MVVGYGQIIPQAVIDMAPLGIINVHASLLPKYRGAGPIQWAIVNGETRTGVTTMRIDAGLDTGDMLLKAETEIGPEETAVELGARLAGDGRGPAGARRWRGLAAGTIAPEKQDPDAGHLRAAAEERRRAIDWSGPRAAIHNRVRGLQPWPGAYTSLRGQSLHIWRSRAGGRRRRGRGRMASVKPPGGGMRRRAPGIAGSPDGRPQAHAGGRFRQRAATGGE